MDTNFSKEFPVGKEEEVLNEEMTAQGTEIDTEAPVVKEDAERVTYTLSDGTAGSRAAFIREKFIGENMSRKDIAEAFDFDYRVVYSATVNMSNEAESVTRGRTATNVAIMVNEDNQLVEVKEVEGANVTYVMGIATETVYAPEDLVSKSRTTWIKEMIKEGVSRGDLAKLLDVSYGTIYSVTKEEESSRSTHMVTLADGTEISRAAYIRSLAEAGKSRGDIAKELNVPYNIVWQATKVEKTKQEKFMEAVAVLREFSTYVEKEEDWESTLQYLEGIVLSVAEEEEAAEVAEAAEAAVAEA